jgi:hypothetical protein
MPAPTDYVPTDWQNNVTPVDDTRMDHIEAGIDGIVAYSAALDTRLAAEEAQPDIPTVVNGQWIKGVGGAMVWSAIAIADIATLQANLDSRQATSQKGVANGYAPLDSAAKVPIVNLPTVGEATVLYVSATGLDTNDGLSWGSAKRQIDAAFTALPAGGGTIHVNPGNYAPFTITDAKGRVEVIGHGAVRIAPTGSQVGITISTTGGTPIVGALIENIHVDGDGEGASTVAMRLFGMSRSTIRRCRISNCLVGIDMFNDAGLFTERNSVENTTINNCGTGVRFWRTATGHTSFSYNRFYNVGVDNCVTVAWDLGGASPSLPDLFGSSFTGCAAWLQDNNAIGVIVACNMLGVITHIDVEHQVGTGCIGWDVRAAALNTDKCTIQSVLIGAWGSSSKVQLAAGKYIRFLPDDDLTEARAVAEGLRGQNFTRELVQGTTILTAGTLQGVIVPLRQGDVVTGLVCGVSVNGTGVTLFKLGLYSTVTPAAKLAETAESSALINAGTVPRTQQLALTTPYVVPADGLYNIVVLSVGGTSPTLIRGVNLAAACAKVGSGHFPHWQSAGGQTDLQAAHNQNVTGVAFWLGWY